jgi:hypothetical protein
MPAHDWQPASSVDPLCALDLRYHSAMVGWCKVVGLQIKAVPECEGGGFAIRQDQAERLVELARASRNT